MNVYKVDSIEADLPDEILRFFVQKNDYPTVIDAEENT